MTTDLDRLKELLDESKVRDLTPDDLAEISEAWAPVAEVIKRCFDHLQEIIPPMWTAFRDAWLLAADQLKEPVEDLTGGSDEGR